MSARPSAPPNISITVTAGRKMTVDVPFCPEFISGVRGLSGYFDRDERHWIFHSRLEQRIRELCVLVYGSDGTPRSTVDVEIDLDTCPVFATPEEWWTFRHGIRAAVGIAGRAIVVFAPVDSDPPRLGDGVELVTGGVHVDSGQLHWDQGTVLEVRGLPEGVLQRIDVTGMTVVGRTDPLVEMRAARSDLARRLRQLDEAIAETECRAAEPLPDPVGSWGVRTLRDSRRAGIKRVLHRDTCNQLAARRRYTDEEAIELMAEPDVGGCPYCKSEQLVAELAEKRQR